MWGRPGDVMGMGPFGRGVLTLEAEGGVLREAMGLEACKPIPGNDLRLPCDRRDWGTG